MRLVFALVLPLFLLADIGAASSWAATQQEDKQQVNREQNSKQRQGKKRAKVGCALLKKRPQGKSACVKMAVEAWYHGETSIADAPPVTGAPELNPYAENTLHVGATAGRENSRTYLVLNLDGLPFGASVVDGTLALTLDEESSSSPKDAGLQACYVKEAPEKNTEGSFDTPPKVDCSIQSEAKYRNKPRPLFRIDLQPFADLLAEPGSGVALVPTDETSEQGASWHTTFFAKKNDSESAVAIAARLRYEEEDTELPSLPIPQDDLFPPPDAGSGFELPASGSADFPLAGQPQSDDVPSDTPELAQSPEELGQEITAAPLTSGPRYMAVWYLPLGLLIGAALLGSLLTRKIEPLR